MLLEPLTPAARASLEAFKFTYLGHLQTLSEAKARSLPGIDEQALETIKSTMKKHGRIWGMS